LIKFICGDKSYTGPLNKLIDISQLSYKDKDDIVDIFKAYDSNGEYNIEKYRDDRLRYLFKERYDVRENLIDWDYHETLSKKVVVVCLNQGTCDSFETLCPFQEERS
jgi:hypothetical protein